MGYYIFLTIMNLLIPALMIVLGNVFYAHAPKNINGLYGYRTNRSMKNKDTWEFAHHFLGILWKKVGGVLLIVSLAACAVAFPFGQKIWDNVSIILVIVQLVVLITSILPCEKTLKKTFDKDGNRK